MFKVNDNLAFWDEHGSRIGVTFPETSNIGAFLRFHKEHRDEARSQDR